MSQAFIYGLLIAIVGSGIAYTFVAYSTRESSARLSTYLYGGARLSEHQVFGTIFASGLSFATVIVSLLQLGTVFGPALLWAILTYCAGWFLFIRVSATIRKSLGPHETIHSFLGRRYNSNLLRRFSSIATMIGFVGSFAIEILAIDLILGTFIIDDNIRTIVVGTLAGLTVLYAVIGGFPAVIKTDRLQSYAIIISIIVILILSVSFRSSTGTPGLINASVLSNVSLPGELILSLFLINVAFPLVDMSAWQRAKAAKSDQAIKKGAKYATLFFFLTWGMLLLSAMIITGVFPSGQDPVTSLLRYAGSIQGVIGFVTGFTLLAGLLCAMFSTADTFLNAASTTLYIDQLRDRELTSHKHLDEFEKQNSVRLRVLTASMGLSGFIACLLLNKIGFGIVSLIFALYGGTLSLLPAVLLALYSSNSLLISRMAPWAVVSIVLGFMVTWGVGLHGVTCIENAGSTCNYINQIITPNAFQAPTFAIGISALIFFFGWIVSAVPNRQ